MLSIQVHSYNKHCIHLRWILCLILSLFTTLPAISQSRVRHQTSLSDTLLKLKEVTIYSNRMQKMMSPVQILSGKRTGEAQCLLRCRCFALLFRSTDKRLRRYWRTKNRQYTKYWGSHHVGVFYDGIELGNAQNGVVDLGRIFIR